MEKYRILRQLDGVDGIRYFDCVEAREGGKQVVIKEFTCRNFAEAAKHIREAIITAEIAHPNICKMLELIPTQDDHGIKIGIVLEHISRTLLQEIEARRGSNPQRRFTEPELRSFLKKVAGALQFASSKVRVRQKVAHRNLNPEHIFIDSQGDYKLSDFGEGWRGNDQKAFAQTLAGQLIFMCPIMKAAKASGQDRVSAGYDIEKVDVYSLGVTLLFMHRLFPPSNLATNNKHDENVRAHLGQMMGDGISKDFAEIVENMVRSDEEARFNATNVMEALSEPSAQTHVSAVLHDSILNFNFETDSWNRQVYSGGRTLVVDENTASTFVDGTSLLVCGGGTSPCKCYADTRTYTVKTNGNTSEGSPMRTGRLRLGLIYHPDCGFVYAFGGVNQSED